MSETWLKGNWRGLAFAIVLPAGMILGGVETALAGDATWLKAIGGSVLLGVALMALLVRYNTLPKLYANGHLLVYDHKGQPIRVPIDAVEGFLLGQGPAMLPGKKPGHHRSPHAGHPSGRCGQQLGRPGNSADPGTLVRRLYRPARRLVRAALRRFGQSAQPASGRSQKPIAAEQPMTKLLVSVRDADEARLAVEAGVELIDVKEPHAGPLGAAASEMIAAIAQVVARHRPLSVAFGELDEFEARPVATPHGITFAKLGLARCAGRCDWPASGGTGCWKVCRREPHRWR